MLGSPLGQGLGNRFPLEDIRDTSATIAAAFTVTPAANFINGQSAPITLTFTPSFTGDGPASTARQIVDTVTYLQKPVDFHLADDRETRRATAVNTGRLSKSALKKIFRE